MCYQRAILTLLTILVGSSASLFANGQDPGSDEYWVTEENILVYAEVFKLSAPGPEPEWVWRDLGYLDLGPQQKHHFVCQNEATGEQFQLVLYHHTGPVESLSNDIVKSFIKGFTRPLLESEDFVGWDIGAPRIEPTEYPLANSSRFVMELTSSEGERLYWIGFIALKTKIYIFLLLGTKSDQSPEFSAFVSGFRLTGQ